MKLNIRAFAVLMAMAIIYSPAWAADSYQYTSDKTMRYRYSVSNGKATLKDIQYEDIRYGTSYGWVSGVPSSITKLTIPTTLGGYPLTTIGKINKDDEDGHFDSLKELVIPECVTSVGLYAFRYLSKITTLTLPGSLTSLGDRVIYNCPQLDTVVFNEGTGQLALGEYALSESGYGPKTIIFHRNAPKTIGEDAIPWRSGTTVWVRPNSTGWGVSIPGTWQGASIKYLKSINFDATVGNVSAATRWVIDGSKVGTLPTPTCPGGTFNGWYTAKSGGTKITASTTVSANTVFYAQWTLNKYTVSFDLNGGEGNAPSRTQDWGTTIGTLPEPTRAGYFFIGWFTESNGGSQIGATDKIVATTTYYAHWERDPIPEMVSGETVAEVLAGAADETLAAKLCTTRNYKSFRIWVDEHSLVHKDVRESPNAWLSYALDAPGLIAKQSAVAHDDFIFAASNVGAGEAGSMSFDFGIEGVTIGEEAELDEVFAITGAATLSESAFTESGVNALLERTSDGKVSVSVEPPKDANGKMPDKFFFRVKVK